MRDGGGGGEGGREGREGERGGMEGRVVGKEEGRGLRSSDRKEGRWQEEKDGWRRKRRERRWLEEQEEEGRKMVKEQEMFPTFNLAADQYILH